MWGPVRVRRLAGFKTCQREKNQRTHTQRAIGHILAVQLSNGITPLFLPL